MNDFATIGTVVNRLRINKQLSQEQLANLLHVSRTVIAKIESGDRKPTQEQLVLLSSKLEFDLLDFQNKIHTYKTLEHYLLANEMMKYLKKDEIKRIDETIRENQMFNELNYGEPQILKTYLEVIVMLKLDNNIDGVLNLCIDLFKIKDIDNIDFQPKVGMPEHYYSMILSLGYCLNKKNNWDNLLKLYINTVKFLESIYLNDNLPVLGITYFYRKYYIICLNNLADTYFELGNYQESFKYCNKGIQFSSKLNILNTMPYLLKLMVELLVKLFRVEEARDVYLQFKAICTITDNTLYFDSVTKALKSNYIFLFE